jgi:hypothetical protein
VLVTGQTTASQNGIYFVSTLGSGNNGTWTRATDANENAEVTSGLIVNVDEGTVYADTTWKLTTNDPIIVGTTELTFVTNLNVGKIIASPASTSVGNTATSIDTFSTSAYRGAKYLITISNSGNHDIIEALLVHDGTTATVTVYGETSTNASLGDITADINSGNVRLLYTGVSAGNSVKLAATYISS